MKAMVCDLCRSNSFSKQGEFFQCDYCRTKYTPEQARRMLVEGTVKIDRSEDTSRLLKIAWNAYEGGNTTEAYDYANRALEIDSNNGQAWFLKGASAGWRANLSSLGPKLREMLQCFNAGASALPWEQAAPYRNGSGQAARAVVEHHYQISLQHMRNNKLDQRGWEEHVNRSRALMDAAEASFELDNNPRSLQLAIWIASGNLAGEVLWQEGVGRVAQNVFHEYRVHLTNRINHWANIVRHFEPGFEAPIPKPAKTGACFVVTATFGREDAPPVVLLREFRDEVLLRTSVGQRAINWYYKHGPGAAEHISRSRILRALTLVTVVAPALVIAMPPLLINRWTTRHTSRTSALKS